jgi:hypothetical protein
MEILYQVIIENQKTRSDLLKWKLILSAGLASIGFGATPITSSVFMPQADYVLCGIPLVAAYVDLLCSHLSLRVQVIGKFIRLTQFADDEDKYFHHYERFVELTRDNMSKKKILNAFALESWAMYASSLVLSGLTIMYGVMVRWNPEDSFHALSFWVSGVAGIALVLGIFSSYKKRYQAINNVPKNYLEGFEE